VRNYRTGLFRKTRFRSGLGRRTRHSRLGPRDDLGFHNAELLDERLEARPGVAGALTALVEPAEEMAHRTVVELLQAGGVALDAIVLIVAPEFGVQPSKQVFKAAMMVLFAPDFEVQEGAPELAARRAAFDLRFTRPVVAPTELEAQEVEAVLAQVVALTERDGAGLGDGEGQAELRQAWSQGVVESLRLNFILEGADEVVGVADQAGFAATLGPDDFVKPEIERIVQVDVSQDRRDDAPLRGTRRGVQHLAVRVQHACFQPLGDQMQQGLVVYAFRQHLEQPVVIQVIEEPLDVGFDHIVVGAELELDGQLVHGIQRPDVGAVAVAAPQEVLLIDGLKNAFDAQLQQLIFCGRYPQWPQLTIGFGDVAPSDEFGMVTLLFEPRHEVLDVGGQVLLVVLGAHPIHAESGVLTDKRPGVQQQVLVQQPVEIAKPVVRLAGSLVCYPLQGGLHCGLIRHVQAMFPLQATSFCQPLPHVRGSPGSEYYGLI